MQLALPADSIPVKEMFERFFATEATSARVRAAEPVGFDAALWQELIALDAPFMRLSAEAGGGEMSLFDTCLMMEQAGRRLAPAPLAEAVVALHILGEVGGATAHEWIEKVRGGEVLTLALHQAEPGKPQLVPGGAAAQGILTFDGKELAIEVPAAPLDAPFTLGGAAIGHFTPGAGTRQVLSSNADAAHDLGSGRRGMEDTHLRRAFRHGARSAHHGCRLCQRAHRLRPAHRHLSGHRPPSGQ